jgi:hypothetical protein
MDRELVRRLQVRDKFYQFSHGSGSGCQKSPDTDQQIAIKHHIKKNK